MPAAEVCSGKNEAAPTRFDPDFALLHGALMRHAGAAVCVPHLRKPRGSRTFPSTQSHRPLRVYVVATENGVYRFVGSGFEQYGREQGIAERMLRTLLPTRTAS